jgi:hypothetical protein
MSSMHLVSLSQEIIRAGYLRISLTSKKTRSLTDDFSHSCVIIASCQLTAAEPTLCRQPPPNRKPEKNSTNPTQSSEVLSSQLPKANVLLATSEPSSVCLAPKPFSFPTPYSLPCLHSLPSGPSILPCSLWSCCTC